MNIKPKQCCWAIFFAIFCEADIVAESLDDSIAFSCLFSEETEKQSLLLFLNDGPPWGLLGNGYYEIESISEQYITAVRIFGSTWRVKQFGGKPGGNLFVLSLVSGEIWVSSIREFMQPYGTGIQAYTYEGKCNRESM